MHGLSGISYVSVGVADMRAARTLWIDQFGMEIVAQRDGPDPDLGALLAIDADQIVTQILLGTPGRDTGHLHFVQFSKPGAAIRGDAKPYDLGAKNLDVNCDDLPEKMLQLNNAGYSFRSEPVEYRLEDVHAREVQMPAHDGINISFIDVLSAGYETPYTDKGYAALTSFVVILKNIADEAKFYEDVFELTAVMEHKLSGPDIETAIGLPSGASLDMRLYGHPDNLFGRMELIHYEGLDGTNRFATAQAPATGILNCNYQVSAIDDFVSRAESAGASVSRVQQRNTICGEAHCVSLQSPAGLKLHVFERK
jgi:catechol 2,3-dioxygenase-like lactoylglutathione lyase family enzyme